MAEDDQSKFQKRLLEQVISAAKDYETYSRKFSSENFRSSDDVLEVYKGIDPLESSELEELSQKTNCGERDEHHVLSTSGTTGGMTEIAFSAQAFDWLQAVYTKRLWQRGLSPFQPRLRYGISSSETNSSVSDILFPRKNIESSQPLDEQIKHIREHSGWLVYFPNVLFSVAKKAKAEGLPSFSGIDGIVCHGEIITDRMKNFIEEFFDAKVISCYSLSETHNIGWGCESGTGYHIDNQTCKLFLEESEKPTDDNIGQVVVSSIVKDNPPVIKFRTGDFAKKHKADCGCPESSERIKILGRKNHILYNESSEPVFERDIVELCSEFNQLIKYQIAGADSSETKLNYVCVDGLGSSVESEIKKRFREKLDLKISLNEVENIRFTKGGKIPVVRKSSRRST